jgi:hypothetical protein
MAHLREFGLRPEDVRVIPAAAGGPKGLILNPLDRYLFGNWLQQSQQTVHLVGASIGAWRMASACMVEPDDALAEMAQDYITQNYEHAPGKRPSAASVSRAFSDMLGRRLTPKAREILSHPRFRLHVVTSRGRHALGREGLLRTPVGYAGAYIANAVSRRALSGWLERVVFSDAREPLPFDLLDFKTRTVALTAQNLATSVLASCAIPFVLKAVHDIPGAPTGAYWDGGITDYHLHWRYSQMPTGLVLYPHFQDVLIPGWLDKRIQGRHTATAALENLVLLAPNPEWVASLPGGKLPDRADFMTYADDVSARVRAWRKAVAAAQQWVDEFQEAVSAGTAMELRPLP